MGLPSASNLESALLIEFVGVGLEKKAKSVRIRALLGLLVDDYTCFRYASLLIFRNLTRGAHNVQRE